MKFWGILAAIVVAVQATAWADCSNPAGQGGSIFYNTTHNVVQFCDGTNWWNTGLANSSAAATACNTPAGDEGDIIYNTSHNVMQFCNGEEWVNMGDNVWTSAAQTGCTTPTATAGTLIYNANLQKVQFCNGSAWIDAVHTVLSGGTPQIKLWKGTPGYHSCAVLPDTTVKCWGYNVSGQLGDNSTATSLIPVAVSGLSGATDLALGQSRSCALINDGTVQCWGTNNNGELGDGTSGINRLTPVAVSGLSGVIALSLGHSHSCALINDGIVQCWGYNSNGQIGDGTSGTDRLTPVPVSGLSNVTALSLGANHSCALINDGTVQCWGSNLNGVLGDGTTTDRLTPVAVSGLTGVTALAMGPVSCAIMNDGTVKCWGANRYGSLGTASFVSPLLTPETVLDLYNTKEVAIGTSHRCALLADHSVKCWGRGSEGQLGTNSTTTNRTPVHVVGLSGVSSVAAGGNYSCAVLNDNTVQCWGENASGQLGDGTSGTNRLAPVAVTGLP